MTTVVDIKKKDFSYPPPKTFCGFIAIEFDPEDSELDRIQFRKVDLYEDAGKSVRPIGIANDGTKVDPTAAPEGFEYVGIFSGDNHRHQILLKYNERHAKKLARWKKINDEILTEVADYHGNPKERAYRRNQAYIRKGAAIRDLAVKRFNGEDITEELAELKNGC